MNSIAHLLAATRNTFAYTIEILLGLYISIRNDMASVLAVGVGVAAAAFFVCLHHPDTSRRPH